MDIFALTYIFALARKRTFSWYLVSTILRSIGVDNSRFDTILAPTRTSVFVDHGHCLDIFGSYFESGIASCVSNFPKESRDDLLRTSIYLLA
jgi:hypothetical protein